MSKKTEDPKPPPDPHTETAAKLFQKPPGKVSKEERREAQDINFAALYGGGRPPGSKK